MKTRWAILLVLLLSVVCVSGMDVSVVAGTKSNGDVSHDFGKTVLRVSPETSYSLNRVHSQIVEVKNTYDSDLYFFVDPYFENSLNNIQIQKLDYETKYTEERNSCTPEFGCTFLPRQEYQVPILSKITSTKKDWGKENHYVTTDGILVKKGGTQQFQITYVTGEDKGKWNARVWAYSSNDWTSIQDDKKTALFDYVIDPLYDMANVSTPNSYWKFDEGTGTNVNDENTTNNNDLTLGGGVVWTTGGKILNDTEYSASTTDYARDTVAGNLPLTLGSVNFWTRPTSKTNGMYLFEFSDGSANNRIAMIYGGSDEIIVYDVVGGSAVAVLTCPSANHKVTNNVYSMISYLWNTTTDVYEMYVNATNVTGCTRLASGNLAGLNYIVIGNSNVFGSGQANVGRIDEFGTWSRILTVYEMQGFFNATLGCAYPFNSCGTTIVLPNYAILVQNATYTALQNETVGHSYTINYTWGANVTNVSNVKLVYQNYIFDATRNNNGTNWSSWNVSDLRTPLTVTNNTAYQFNWTYTSVLDNATNQSNTTSNYAYNIKWSYYPINIFITTPIIETTNTSWNVTYNITGGNTTGVSFAYVTTWNVTNVTGTHTINNTAQINASFNYIAKMLNSTDNYKLINLTPFLNVTFNGTTYARNGISGATNLTAGQGVYKMMLNFTNLSTCGAPANTTAINFSIKDANGSYVPSADVNASFLVYLYSGMTALNRTYNYTVTDSSLPFLCLYPSFASLYVNWNMNVTGDGGRSTTDSETNFLITNISVNHTIYFLDQFNIIFRDETNYSLITPDTVYADFISDNATYNYSTTTGYLQANVAINRNYTIRYWSPNYGLLREYYFEFLNTTNTTLTLYLINETISSPLTITVYDENTLLTIQDAVVYLQRYNLSTNSFSTVAMYRTDVSGKAYFDVELSNEYYKFLVDYPWRTSVFSSDQMYIQTTSLNLYVNLQVLNINEFFNINGITGTITYSNSTGTPTMTVVFNDPALIGSNYCFYIKNYGQYSSIIINSTCTTSASGSLSLTGLVENKINYGVFTATIGGEELVINTGWKTLPSSGLNSGRLGMFLTFGLYTTLLFFSWFHLYAIILAGMGLLFAKILGIFPVDIGYIIAIIATSIFVSMFVQKRE